jgi:signal transduction histidine kinase
MMVSPPAWPGPLSPGTVPSWQAAAARAALVTAAAVAFGVVAQWPMASFRPWLFACNLVVSGGFAVGSVLVSDEPRHAGTRRALLVASILWSVGWVQVWNAGPLPFIASLTGPAPATVAIWGLLRFPQPWRDRRAARAVLAVLVLMQVASAAMTLTEDNPSGWWPRMDAPSAHAVLLSVYNDGGVACALLLAGLFVFRLSRLRGHELRITVPIGFAIVAGGVATAFSDTAAAVGTNGYHLWTFYTLEDLLLACVPASFILSYALRRASIEELSGRIDPYETLPQARDKLRRALRDPTLQILLPASSSGRWIDADGHEQPFPTDAERLTVPVDDGEGNHVAVVSVHPSLARFGDLLTATVQSLILVLDNARLLAQLRDELTLIEQSRARIEEAVAAERRQIQHRSGAGPLTLAETARQHLDSAVAALTAAGHLVPGSLAAARTTVAHATADIRRLSSGAEPLGLGNGLAEALPRALAVHPTVHVEVADLRADPEVEQVAYFVVTAAVGNAIMHAGPAATVTVTITGTGETPTKAAFEFLQIEVRDNGFGGADPSGHGLTLMAGQVRAIGGTLDIDSPATTGTTIRAVLPRFRP